MEKNFDKIVAAIGNNSTYQKRLVLVVFLLWMTVDFIAISIPYLEVNRKVTLFDPHEKQFKNVSLNYTICAQEKNFKNKTAEISGHSWTIEFDIECDPSLVGLIGSFAFTGVLIGSFSFQVIPDLIGRKTTIIFSTIVFIISLVLFCSIKSLKFIYANLIVNQMFSNICLLTTFMMTLEIVSIEDRSFYGAVINSAFSFCGVIFISLYKYLNDWRECFFLATTFNFVVLLIFCTVAIESPRYYVYKQEYNKVYLMLMRIAKINKKEEGLNEFLRSPDNAEFQALVPADVDFNTRINNGNSNYQNFNIKQEEEIEKLCNSKSKEKNKVACKTEIQMAKVEIHARNDAERNLIEDNKNKEIKIDKSKENQEYNTISENNDNNNNKQTKDECDINTTPKSESSFFDLLSYKNLRRRFLIVCYLWFSTSGIYYGLSINIKNLPGDVYTNGIFIYTAEIFSYIISGYIIETSLGRKNSMILFESISFFGYLIAFAFKIKSYWLTVISFVARFAISAVYNIIYTYSVEIYPTTLRAKGFGTNSLCARFGGIFFPILIEMFAEYVQMFFLSLNLIAIVLILYLPETLGKPLKDEVDPSEEE